MLQFPSILLSVQFVISSFNCIIDLLFLPILGFEDFIIQMSKIDDMMKEEADNFREVVDTLCKTQSILWYSELYKQTSAHEFNLTQDALQVFEMLLFFLFCFNHFY